MQVSIVSFFDSLNVCSKYYIKQFKSYGIENRFFLSKDDLQLIVNSLPTERYKSALVVQRAKNLLDDLEVLK